MKLRMLINSRVTKNAGWLIGGKLVNMGVSFLVSLLTARYLGPSNYGLINYATAYTTFFFSICTLGINSVLVKEFVDHPKDEGCALGTSLVLRGIASLLSAFVIIGLVYLIDNDEPLTVAVTVLCSVGLLFRVFETINYWFQAHLASKYSSIAVTIAYLITALYKLILLSTEKDVRWFALSTSVDYAVIAVILFCFYKRSEGPAWSFSGECARRILRQSCYFILPGLMVSIYGSTDRLMLKQMLDETAVGYYSIAVTLCNIWVFVLSAIIESVSPVIMQQHNRDRIQYEKYNRTLYALVFYISVFVSLCFTLFGDFAISLIYGTAYQPAAAPLKVITWYVAFSYLGVARNTWIVCEGKQRYIVYIYIGAAVLNVALNALFIPIWGTVGAATASLITQVSTILVFPMMIRELRPNVYMMLQAISFVDFRNRE